MIDYQRTIDDIQSILYSGGMLPLDALSALSQSYARACEEANERLRDCQELLRKGLRAEAIQLCEVEPNLLDWVNTLDFPERAQWCAVLRDSKLLTPPELLVEVAADLNAAYAQEQPLTSLMRRHRLLALARAPLRQRISTLRQIMEADPENSVWEDDLKTYERVRHDQIQSAVAAAGRQKDVGALTALEKELQDPDWREAPPATLVRGVSRATIRARKSRARDRLAALVPELAAAHSQMDFEGACQLRERWLGAAHEAGLQPNDELAQSVASVLEWLELEDEKEENNRAFAMNLSELEQGLDDNASHAELERIHSRLPQFDQEIPAALEHRYQSRLDSLALGAARRSKLILVATIGVLLLTAALTGAFIVRQIRSQTVAGYASGLEQLLNDGALSEADQYWTKLAQNDESAVAEPQLADLKVRLDGLLRAEADREMAFGKALEAAQAAPLDTPDRRALEEANRLAKTESERLQLNDLERRIAAHSREMQRERDEAFVARIDELSAHVANLEKGGLLEFETRLDAVKDVLRQVATLEREGSGVSAGIRGNLNPLKLKLQSWQRTEMADQRKEQQLEKIANAVGNHQAFRDQLLKYASDFPGTDRAETFSKIVKTEVPLWEAIATWQPLVRRWSSEDATKLTSSEATKRIAEAKSLLSEHKLFAEAGAVEQRLPYLEAIASREGPEGRIERDLIDKYLKFYFVDGVFEVRAADGTRYFCKNRPQGNTIKYLADNNPSTPTRLKLLSPEVIAAAVKAPQSVASTEAQSLLVGLTNENWEKTFWDILRGMYANEQMDPIIKIQLMDAVLRVGCKGSRCLERAFGRQRADLGRASESVKDVDWVSPNNEEARAKRAEADSLLQRWESALYAAAKQAAADRKQLANSPFAHRYDWIGWLHRDMAGQWRFKSGPGALPATAELCVVSLDSPGDRATVGVTVIGKLDGKSATLTSDDSRAFVEGRPVYARVPTDRPR